jgi:voltage-gated potassium channel
VVLDKEHKAKARKLLIKHAVSISVVSVIAVTIMILVYSVAPEPANGWDGWEFVLFGAIALIAYSSLIIAAIVRLYTSPRPLLEGVLFVIVLVAVLVLSYSWVYLSMSRSQPEAFSEVLDKQSAAYFTVTVLSTVGFGDIVPKLGAPRMVVTSQMIIGFTLFTLAIKVVTGSAKRAIQIRQHDSKSS